MTGISSKSSVLAIQPESTEGTLRAPTAATVYVPLQDDWTMEANVDTIDNAELRSSIGAAPKIRGAENPKAGGSFYIKASGVEGSAPAWSDIAKAFFGSEVSEGTQRTTVAAAANVDTFTLESLGSTTGGDHAIFSDTAGNTWAFSLDTTGSDPAPTAALYAAVAAGRKAHVDISGGGTATQNSDLVRTALNLLSGFSALFTTSGTATLIVTSDNVGYVAPAHVYNSAESTSSGVMTYVHTTAGRTASTAALLQSVDASTNMQRGYGMLIKDTTNGYRVRAVHSVSVDAITPSFNVPNAPAAGTGLGKPVFWKPADSGHQSLTLFWYGGNGGLVQAEAGARPVTFGIDAKAGAEIKGSTSFEALSFYLNPIEITSSTRYMDFTDDDGTFACALTARWYKTPQELALALQTAMNAASTGETKTVTYSNSTGKFTITSTGTLLSLLLLSGSNNGNSIYSAIGFTQTDKTGTGASTGYTGTNAITLTSPYTPSLDASQPLVAKNQEVMLGDQADYTCVEASSCTINGTDARRAIESICAETGRSGSIFTARDWEIKITGLVTTYDSNFYEKFRAETTCRFQYTMGTKTGGNWDAGYVVYAYGPTCKITQVTITNDAGLISYEATLVPFVNDSGEGEFYVGVL